MVKNKYRKYQMIRNSKIVLISFLLLGNHLHILHKKAIKDITNNKVKNLSNMDQILEDINNNKAFKEDSQVDNQLENSINLFLYNFRGL